MQVEIHIFMYPFLDVDGGVYINYLFNGFYVFMRLKLDQQNIVTWDRPCPIKYFYKTF